MASLSVDSCLPLWTFIFRRYHQWSSYIQSGCRTQLLSTRPCLAQLCTHISHALVLKNRTSNLCSWDPVFALRSDWVMVWIPAWISPSLSPFLNGKKKSAVSRLALWALPLYWDVWTEFSTCPYWVSFWSSCFSQLIEGGREREREEGLYKEEVTRANKNIPCSDTRREGEIKGGEWVPRDKEIVYSDTQKFVPLLDY